MHRFFTTICCCLLSLCIISTYSTLFAQQAQNNTPNIIYILADDLGYGDVSHLNANSKLKTTHIDQLASNGMTFTDMHTNSSVCTPTRYGILTGRYAWRTTLKSGVTWSYDSLLISQKRMTLASMLKNKGYVTACIGKWHLGLDWQKDVDNTPQFRKPITAGPNQVGFDYFYGITASLDIPPYFYLENNRITAKKIDTIAKRTGKAFWRESPIGDDFVHEEVLPRFTEKALRYIRKQAQTNQPFFLYFPLPAPHTPILPTKEFLGKSNTNEYGDFVLMVDDVIGQISAAVREMGIEENTLIVFTSDNGCSPMADFEELAAVDHHPSDRFRGHKADIYDGGHRVPFIVSWPKRIPKASRSDALLCLTDFFATTAALTNTPLSDQDGEDSFNFFPVLMGEHSKPIRNHIVHHSVNGSFALRQGPWKVNFCPGSGGWSAPKPKKAREDNLPWFQLYHMDNDPGETQNLAAQYPKIVKKFTKKMKKIIEKGRSTPGAQQGNAGTTTFYPWGHPLGK